MKRKILYTTITVAVALTTFFIGKNTAQKEVSVVEKEILKEVVPDNYVNMKDVVNFTATEDRFQLYFNDGTGFYWGP